MIYMLFKGLSGVFFARVNVNKPNPRSLSTECRGMTLF